MAILRLNVIDGDRLDSADLASEPWRDRLRALALHLPARAPIAILIHGYRYTWRAARRRGGADAHQSLYRDDPLPPFRGVRPRRANWPHALGFSPDDPADGLCVALGWDARDPSVGGFARVYAAAAGVARALARLIEEIAAAAPGRRIDCFAHSLGARVAIQALRRAPDAPIHRAILLGPAEYAGEAEDMLAAQDAAGARVEILHVAARANRLFDRLFRLAAPPPRLSGDVPLGLLRKAPAHPRWLTIEIDEPSTRDALRTLGTEWERPARAVSHWCFYDDQAAMTLYRRLLREREDLTLARLKREIRAAPPPGWTRRVFSRGGRAGDEAAA